MKIHSKQYSIYSSLDKHNLSKKYNLDLVNEFKHIVDFVNNEFNSGTSNKDLSNDFQYVEFINYIPLEDFKLLVLDLYKIYLKEFPYGYIKSFIDEYFYEFISQIRIILKFINKYNFTLCKSQGEYDFYTYKSPDDFRMIVWKTKGQNDTHFYSLYLKALVFFLEIEVKTTHTKQLLANSETLLSDIDDATNQQQEQNPKHENIFSNNGFILFDHILKEYVKTKRGRKSDIHFFYWSMYNNDPQYIHQRPEPFKKWFFDNYNFEDLGKIKTYNNVDDPDRRKHYSNALDWFKQQTK
jgi:hypothetical protein